MVLERSESARCPVRLTRYRARRPWAMRPAPAILTPDRITVSAPASAVARVADCIARVTTEGLGKLLRAR